MSTPRNTDQDGLLYTAGPSLLRHLDAPLSDGDAGNVPISSSSPHETGVYADQAARLSAPTSGEALAMQRSFRSAVVHDSLSLSSTRSSNPLLPPGSDFQRREWTCPHYHRRCWMRADCCDGRYVACRHCHNEAADHQLDRFSVTHVACRTCGAKDVPIGKTCCICGVDFARYYCEKCNLIEDDIKSVEQTYHCDFCGVCRRGRGLGIDNHHCSRCERCLPLEVKDSHPCIPQGAKASCPVCMDELLHSITQVIIMPCGHAIHGSCFDEYTKRKYTCPICCKSLTDMSGWFKALDERIELERKIHPLREEMAARQSDVYCSDCQKKSTVRWHYRYHKCHCCGSYNTRVI